MLKILEDTSTSLKTPVFNPKVRDNKPQGACVGVAIDFARRVCGFQEGFNSKNWIKYEQLHVFNGMAIPDLLLHAHLKLLHKYELPLKNASPGSLADVILNLDRKVDESVRIPYALIVRTAQQGDEYGHILAYGKLAKHGKVFLEPNQGVFAEYASDMRFTITSALAAQRFYNLVLKCEIFSVISRRPPPKPPFKK